MPEPNITLPILKRASQILKKRGWKTGSFEVDGPLNIRSAISIACGELATTEQGVYVNYCRAVATLSLFLKDGVTSWEFGTHASKPRPRKESEVFELFDKVIGKLESHEEKVRVRTGRNSSSTAV